MATYQQMMANYQQVRNGQKTITINEAVMRLGILSGKSSFHGRRLFFVIGLLDREPLLPQHIAIQLLLHGLGPLLAEKSWNVFEEILFQLASPPGLVQCNVQTGSGQSNAAIVTFARLQIEPSFRYESGWQLARGVRLFHAGPLLLLVLVDERRLHLVQRTLNQARNGGQFLRETIHSTLFVHLDSPAFGLQAAVRIPVARCWLQRTAPGRSLRVICAAAFLVSRNRVWPLHRSIALGLVSALALSRRTLGRRRCGKGGRSVLSRRAGFGCCREEDVSLGSQ
jgi:hypothetical protein